MAGRREATTSYNRRGVRNVGTGYSRKPASRRVNYLEGSAAKQLDYAYEAERLPAKKKISNTTRKNREKAQHMNPGYVLFLTVALCIAGFTLCKYVELQSSITGHVKTLARLEMQYNNLKLANDEEYNRINSSIDLEQVRAIAIGELGMTYAQAGQIISIPDAETDYVRQSTDLK